MSEKTNKVVVLNQEVVRITCLNCSRYLQWKVTANRVSEVRRRMQYAEYNENFETEVVKSVMKAYEKYKELTKC